jgi:hypothetical protein
MVIRLLTVALTAAGIIALGLASPAFAQQKHAQMQMPGQQMQAPGQQSQMTQPGPGNPFSGGSMSPGQNGGGRPPGWSHGKKRGWGGHNMPPGQYKKQFR